MNKQLGCGEAAVGKTKHLHAFRPIGVSTEQKNK